MAHTDDLMINGILTPVTVFDSSAQEIDDSVERSKNAVKKSGDTMDYYSKIKFPLTNGKGGAVFALADGVLLQAYADITDDSSNRTGFKAFSDGRVCVVSAIDGMSRTYNILHTGNKPSGSYTGNGDATPRTIEIGGLGDVVAIMSSSGSALVFGGIGALVQSAVSGANRVASSEVKVTNNSNCVLTLATTNGIFNASGITYYYQVL